MQYLALATDYDGTIAHDGVVDDETLAALERLRASARKLILVTGRELDDLVRVLPRLDIFDLVVAENGALLYDPANREEHTLGEPPPPRFVERLRALQVDPLSVGRVIVASWEPNEGRVLQAIRECELELQITFNKGAVMVLPAGVNKASGLEAALVRLGLSPLNCVAVGDAENDLAFLDVCGFPVAVANALDSLKERVSLVTEGARGAGVAELVDRMLATDLAEFDEQAARGRVALAADPAGEAVLYPPQRSTLLVTGQSGSGKSTMTLGVLERAAEAGLQWCVLDPEGDYAGIEGAVTEGSEQTAPDAAQMLDLLRKTASGVVVNMLAVPVADRPEFFARMLPELLALRAKIGRPHIIVVDEAHHMLPREGNPSQAAIPSDQKGFVFLTTHPEQVSPLLLESVDRLIVVGRGAEGPLEAFCRARGIDAPADVPELEASNVLLLNPGEGPVRRLDVIPGTNDRRRHRRKYAQGKLGADTSFYFRGEHGTLNLRAHNLMLFVDMGDGVDEATWQWHRERGDYSRWLQDCVKDSDLADEVADVERGAAPPAEARQTVRAAIEKRYTAPG